MRLVPQSCFNIRSHLFACYNRGEIHLSIWTLPECPFWTQGIIDGITPLPGRDNRRYQSIQLLICQRKISTRMITTKNIPFVDDIPILNSECLLPFLEGYQPSNIHNWVETAKNDLTNTSGRKKTQLLDTFGCIPWVRPKDLLVSRPINDTSL